MFNHQEDYMNQKPGKLGFENLIRCMAIATLVFMGVSLVLIVAYLAVFGFGPGADWFFSWLVFSLPVGIVNALFLWLLYALNIDRRPLTSLKHGIIECVLLLLVFGIVIMLQDYFADFYWYKPVEVLWWYSDEVAIPAAFLIVLTIYLIKKALGKIGRR